MHHGTCERCGTAWVSQHPTKRFCSERCRRRAENARREQRGHRPPSHRKYTPSFDLTVGRVLPETTHQDRGRYHTTLAMDSCTYCGSNDDLSIDHIVPSSAGGTNDWTNWTSACRACNTKKRGATLLGFLAWTRTSAAFEALAEERARLRELGPPRTSRSKAKACGPTRRRAALRPAA